MIPKYYTQQDFIHSFNSLPARFGAQRLLGHMHEVDAIAQNHDLTIALELYLNPLMTGNQAE